jgi:multimeric flavodoxin WrbA
VERKGLKVLGIQGSARRDGNTHDLLEAVLKGAASGGAKVSRLALLDYDIKQIGDCRACLKKGLCVNQDDYAKVIRPVLDADVIVWGSPVYWYSVSGLIKVFLDRWSCNMCWKTDGTGADPTYMDFIERMAGKGTAVVSTQEGEGKEGAQHLFGAMDMTFAFFSWKVLGKLVAKGGERGTVRRNTAALRRAHSLGLKVAKFRKPPAKAQK